MAFEAYVLKNYTVLRPHLVRALLVGAPFIFEEYDEECVAECMHIIQEVLRVARELEAERRVSGSRVPRLLRELYETLDLFARNRTARPELLENLRFQRKRSAESDKALLTERPRFIRDEYARLLARELRDKINGRLKHFYSPVLHFDAIKSFADMEVGEKKRLRKVKQAVLLHTACMFDVNECELDWFPTEHDKNK